MSGNTLQDIQVNVGADIKDFKQKMLETQSILQRQARQFSDVGRSITRGINEPLLRANFQNRELQAQLLKSTSALDGMIGVAEVSVVTYSALAPKVSQAVVAFKALNAVQKASVIGATIAGVGLAVTALKGLYDMVNKNTAGLQNFRDVNLTANKSIVAQQFEVNQLIDVFADSTKSVDDRKDAVKRLIEIAPEHFGMLDGEKSSYNDATEAADAYTAAIKKNALAKASEQKVIELMKQRLDLEAELEKAETASNSRSVGILGTFTNASALWSQYRTVPKIKGDIEDLNKQITDMTFVYQENAPAVRVSTEETKKGGKAVKEKVKQLEGYIDIMGQVMLFGGRLAEGERKIFEDARQRLQANVSMYKIDGDAKRLMANSSNQLRGAIRKLIDAGYSPESDAVAKLLQQYERLNSVRGVDKLPTILDRDNSSPEKTIDDPISSSGKGSSGDVPAWFKKHGHYIEKAVDLANELADAMSESFQRAYDAKEAAIDSATEKERLAIERSKVSEETKQAKLIQLERKRESELAKIRYEQAKKDRSLAIFQATINSAVAVTKALASNNYAGAVAAAAIGAVQISLVSSEPLPALAEGGLAFGQTTAIVGDNPNANVDPEVIAPLSKLKGMMGDTDVRVWGQFKASGDELLAVIENSEASRNRRRA